MTSPRRRHRSHRVLAAYGLLGLAIVIVAVAAVVGSWTFLGIAAFAGVALGAIALRITHLELVESRLHAASDRAGIAKDYRALTDVRVDENAKFINEMSARIERHETTIGRLEKRLSDAAADVIETRQLLAAATDRALGAEAESARLRTSLANAEERAAEAIVRLAELEQEIDIVTAELDSVKQSNPLLRKHA